MPWNKGRWSFTEPERLLAYLRSRSIVNERGCLLWQGGGSTHADGTRGAIVVDGTRWRLPRAAYRLYHGEYDLAYDVLHTCDTPLCWAKEHLFLGTHTDNMRDMCRKGRLVNPRGEWHGAAVLTEAQVLEIRQVYKYHDREYGSVALAKHYGVSQYAVWAALKGWTWAHVE